METENVVAEAIFDFTPNDSIELTLKKGDTLTIRRSAGNGWLEGEKDGKIGLFPSSYIKTVEQPTVNSPPASAKKPLIDNMLALEQKSTFVPEKAAELFVDGHRARIVAGPQWREIDEPMVIVVRDPQIETRFNGMKQFTVYVVETEALGAVVSRRYKHFLWLYDRLADLFPCLSLPPMPVKQFSGNLDPEFVYHRRRGLERFLNRCACHPVFAYSKVFHDFLTRKDEKDWKIGSKSKPKKLFSPIIYSAVEYPQHNVPHSELVYVEKFSQFLRLLEANMTPVQQTCQKQGDGYGSIALSMTELGCNLQKLAKGTQLETKNPASRKGSGQTTSMNAVQKQIRSAAELEENCEEPKYNWGWKDTTDFTTLMSDLQEVGSEICKIAELFNFQQGILDQTLTDLVTDYNGIILTTPGLVKLHQDAMEIYENSKKSDTKKDAETMKLNCETLHNIVLAEFDYLHRNLIADFRYIIALYLRKQADFHLQLAERYELLHQSFMHMNTNIGCQPPMSTNGVDVPAEVSDSDDDDNLLTESNKSELEKKTAYLNVFPKSCYENVQFKLTKGGLIEPKIVTSASAAVSADKTTEVDVINTIQSINSPPTTDHSSDTAVARTTDTTNSTSSVTSATASVLSNISIPVSEAAVNKPAATVVVVTPPAASSSELTDKVVSTANSNNTNQSTTTTSVSTSSSADDVDGPVSANNDPTITSNSNTKVNSDVIEVGDINPVYQSWQTLKKKNDSEPINVVATNKSNAGASSAYDQMEPILKPSTHNSSVFLSAASSVIDNQISQSSAPSDSLYENVVRVGNGKFTVTPPSSCDSKDSLTFPLEGSPNEQQSSINRSNSTGSLLPQPAVQHQATFYSPSNSRKETLKQSASLSATPQLRSHLPSNEMSKSVTLPTVNTASKDDSKIHVRGSTAINRGSVKKKITMFEKSTTSPTSKSLAEMGIFEDQDSGNGFIV